MLAQGNKKYQKISGGFGLLCYSHPLAIRAGKALKSNSRVSPASVVKKL